MKHTILTTAIIAISVCSLYAESFEVSDEAEILRREIKEQELVLQAMKQRLSAPEDTYVAIISVDRDGRPSYSIHGKQIDFKELEKALADLPDDAKILIQAKPDPSNVYGRVSSMISMCNRAGLKNIALGIAKAQAGADQPAIAPQSKTPDK